MSLLEAIIAVALVLMVAGLVFFGGGDDGD